MTAGIRILSYDDDPLEAVATQILERFSASLPDLTRAVVLLPAGTSPRRLQQALVSRSGRTLLAPNCTTLTDWLAEQVPDCGNIASREVSELMLAEALKSHAHLFGDTDPWRIADHLLPLFDVLSRNRFSPESNEDTFVHEIANAYGIEHEPFEPVTREAVIIYRVWQAWRQQLEAEGWIDEGSAHVARLAASLERCEPESHLYFLPGSPPSTIEQSWIRALRERGQLTLILQGLRPVDTLHPDAANMTWLSGTDTDTLDWPVADPFSAVLHKVFPDGSGPLSARAIASKEQIESSPLTNHLSFLAASSAEHEARAADVQVRQWLIEGKQSVAIVTEDRKLARRVRALLERAGVPVHDHGGWALSTTSAAAVVGRWLQTVEQDFDHVPLLDTLKSPFAWPADDSERYLEGVYRFEADLVHKENIGRGLHRYREVFRQKRQYLGWPEGVNETVDHLLSTLQRAAKPLLARRKSRNSTASDWLDALRSSLEIADIWQTLQNDDAGQQLIEVWQALHTAACSRPTRLDWAQFRTWFGRALERAAYIPTANPCPIHLMNLKQSRLGRFDAIALIGCDREHLPGAPQPSPFFNFRVRAELGLGGWRETLVQRHHDFRCLLQAAPQIMVSWQAENEGEPRLPSPWIDAIRTFSQFAYGHDLANTTLGRIANHAAAAVQPPDPGQPALRQQRPAPTLSRAPANWSAGRYQRLVDCPYHFFAADGLGLKPREEISEALAKADFGERVHRCLQLFHSDVTGFPGPFGEPLTDINRGQAKQLLEKIGDAVFRQDVDDSFEHRGWLRQWEAIIPHYLDWQIEHGKEWQVNDTELDVDKELSPGLRLRGRIDRVDHRGDQTCILDYKTGATPALAEIETGEAVQLPFYALVLDQLPDRVAYLTLTGKAPAKGVAIEGEQITDIAARNASRLSDLFERISNGAALPAHGDTKACRYCEMDGLCRLQAWNQQTDPEA